MLRGQNQLIRIENNQFPNKDQFQHHLKQYHRYQSNNNHRLKKLWQNNCSGSYECEQRICHIYEINSKKQTVSYPLLVDSFSNQPYGPRFGPSLKISSSSPSSSTSPDLSTLSFSSMTISDEEKSLVDQNESDNFFQSLKFVVKSEIEIKILKSEREILFPLPIHLSTIDCVSDLFCSQEIDYVNLKEFDTYPKQKVFKKSLAQFKFIDHDLLFPSKSQSFQTQPKFPQTKTFEMPSSDAEKPMVSDNRDGTISVKYDPKQEGNYELQIKHNNMPIKGSPYKFVVDNTPKGLVTAFGTGLSSGVAGEPCSFNVYTKGSGAANLQVAVEGPSKAEINCKDSKDGGVNVSFVPPAPGEYKINVNYGGKPIKGSPFSAKIIGEGRKRSQISIGMSSEVPLKITEKDVKLLNASIIAPSGLEEPCFLRKLNATQLGISFTPREFGDHAVNVKKQGHHVNGSPFKINVLERDIGDSKNVKISGAGLKEGKTNTANEVMIDTKDAGYGGLGFSVEGPSKAEIQYQDKGNGKLVVTYNPSEPGFYIVNAKFADHHVPGSPYTIKVTGPGSNIQRNNIKLGREAAAIADAGSKCKLTFKIPGTSAFDMAAKIASPSGEVEDAEILDFEDCLYAVQFVPKEVGIHIVSVRHKDIHIPGSPFQFTVGPLTDFGSHRVHAGGLGLERATVNELSEFNIWTREAGAGTLAVSVEGPSKAEIDFKDRKDGSGLVTYKVSKPGEYRIGIKFNDQHIPDSPYNIYAVAQAGDARKIEIGAIPPEHMLKVNSPVTFTINMNGAKGNLDGKVIAPSGGEDDCFLSKIDDDQWALRFIPRENGVHRIYVRFNGVHIPESPFSMRIGHDDADPAAVSVHGNGIKDCRTGVKTDFIIDTCNAGAGTLAVTIDGPTKVSMDCTEVEEGYKVRYTPLAPGEYLITVKYNGYHIVGSPFKVRCVGTKSIADISDMETAQVVVETVTKYSKNKGDLMPKFKSDANMVESKGLGLKRAVLNRQNTFHVNASNAGNNMMYVAIFGPRGPCEGIDVRHQGRNNYNVTYTTRERGEHLIVCKYGEDHIPGSPFRIECNP